MPPNAPLVFYGLACAFIGAGLFFIVFGDNKYTRVVGFFVALPAFIVAWFAWFAWFAVVTP